MIKNVIFDIGNVILNFNIKEVLQKFTSYKEEQEFIYRNIINSPEWLGNALIDTGYLSRDDAIEIVKDRTNHSHDKLINDFWKNYNDFASINKNVLKLIQKLKNNNYKIYLLSNINPYKAIYNTLLEKYKLIPNECIFIDDNQNNIDTGNLLGIISRKVEPDNYDSIVKIIKEFNLI